MPQLKAVTPYSFDLFYQILQRYPKPSLFHVRGGAYFRVVKQGEKLSLAKVTSSGNVDTPQLEIEWLIGNAQNKALEAILGIDKHIGDFYEFAQKNEPLWTIVEPLYGLPLDIGESVFQTLMFVIIEQHISWVNAQKAQRVLVEWGDNFIEYEGIKHYAMPTVEQIAEATIEDLKALKITFKRMNLMIDIAKQVLDGSLDLESMLKVPPEAMYKDLLKIKGVGHWTASVVVSRARGIFPYVAHNDVALQAAVREYFGVEKSASTTQAIFAQYGEFAGLAAHFTLMKWVLDKYPIVDAKV